MRRILTHGSFGGPRGGWCLEPAGFDAGRAWGPGRLEAEKTEMDSDSKSCFSDP